MSFDVDIFPIDSDQDVRAAFEHYKDECLASLKSVFDRGEEAEDLCSWLEETATDRDIATDLMHDEPIKSVSKYLGIDLSGDDYIKLVKSYSRSTG